MNPINPVDPYFMQMQPYQFNPVRNPLAPQQGQDLIRVNGMDSVKAYPTQPNSRYALFDENDDIMYIKRTDASNFPTITRYRFVEEAETPKQAFDSTKYLTVEEFNKFKEELFNGEQFIRSKSNSRSGRNGHERNAENKGHDAAN